MPRPTESSPPIRVGLSSCLLGKNVRFDGGHKRDAFITDLLAEYFDYVPVCPELEVGMGVPRESVRLVGSAAAPRLVGGKSGTDWTERMVTWAEDRLRRLERHDLCGFILKKGSPTCGMERVRVYNPKGMPERDGRGLFAMLLIEHFPLLPVEEEGRLHDPALREGFVVRVFAYHRLRTLFASKPSRGQVVAFHTAQKFLLLAHSPPHYQTLGRLVARIKHVPPAELAEQYTRLTLEGLAVLATRRKHANVLQHLAGFLRQHLDDHDRAELHTVIGDYQKGLVPLIVPMTLLRHHVARHDITYVADQVYLNPHPKELMLRNHV